MISSRIQQILCCISIGSLLASCTPIVDNRGHNLEPDDFRQIIENQSREEDVEALLGSPTAKSTFGDKTWYYITTKRETLGVLAPEVTEQQVTAIRFHANGTVAEIANHGKDEAKSVQFVTKATPTEGQKLTIMEQLLGNLGRFSSPGRQVDPRNMGR